MSDDWDRYGDCYLQGALISSGVDGMPISKALKKLLKKWKKERGYDPIKNPEARYHNDKS